MATLALTKKGKAKAHEWIDKAPDGWEIEFRERKKNRLLSQNRLSHMWYGQRSDYLGTTRDYEHRLCKLRYGCPILIESDPDFAEIYQRAIEPLAYEDRIKAMKYMPVTRMMNVSQMSEYLSTIERESYESGVALSHPEDLYYEAMRN